MTTGKEKKWAVVIRNMDDDGTECSYPLVWVYDTWEEAHDFCVSDSNAACTEEQRCFEHLPCIVQHDRQEQPEDLFTLQLVRDGAVIVQWDCVDIEL